jgi:phosphoribosylaminoimidazolecarboxamide formyltransferase/IMP cyclohydrolase
MTLTPSFHGGMLAVGDEQEEELAQQDPPWPVIDLLFNTMYDLDAAVVAEDATEDSVLESTDIGGPCMRRSAAKGRRIVITDPNDCDAVLSWLDYGRPNEKEFLRWLGAKTEFEVTRYTLVSALFHAGNRFAGFLGKLRRVLAYGENRRQKFAALYALVTGNDDPLALHNFEQIKGLSQGWINATDMDRALPVLIKLVLAMDINLESQAPCVAVGIKHGNGCGIGVGDTPRSAIERMVDGDPEAIFGGTVLTNFVITADLASCLRIHGSVDGGPRILDQVIAPEITPGAIEELDRSTGRCRMFVNKALEQIDASSMDETPRFRQVRGGILVQDGDGFILDLAADMVDLHGSELSDVQKLDILIAWAHASCANSNTVALAKEGMLIGSGVGQRKRSFACFVAIEDAHDSGHDLSGAAAVSDSFFLKASEEREGPRRLADAGVRVIFATGRPGTKEGKDSAVIDFCAVRGIALVLAPDPDARGFSNH